ncbi:hypothetical protein Tco_0862386 [Tanacetum coccineum]
MWRRCSSVRFSVTDVDTNCLRCDLYQVKGFELVVVSFIVCLAAVALLCLRKYGVRKFLFVDQYHGHVQRFSKDYVHKIDEAKRALVIWFLPCLILKIAREVVRFLDCTSCAGDSLFECCSEISKGNKGIASISIAVGMFSFLLVRWRMGFSSVIFSFKQNLELQVA